MKLTIIETEDLYYLIINRSIIVPITEEVAIQLEKEIKVKINHIDNNN